MFRLTLNCNIKNITITIKVNDESYFVFCTTPFGAEKNNKKTMKRLMEFVCRANFSMYMGCLEIDCDDGKIVFLNRITCEHYAPSAGTVRKNIYHSAISFILYSVGIRNIIIINDYSAKKALKKCENPSDDIISVFKTLLSTD